MKARRTMGWEGYGRARKARSSGPIIELQDMRRIRAILRDKPRDLLLFDLATRTGLRMTDLLRLRVRDLRNATEGEKTSTALTNGGGPWPKGLKETVQEAFRRYLSEIGPSDDDYLFKSRKGSGPLSISSVSHMIQGWFRAANLEISGGSRVLRKTWKVLYRNPSQLEEEASGRGEAPHVLKPIEASTLQERVYGELLRAIVSGRIPPGERIVTEKIAGQLNVSHMPVRDALGRLEAGGFVARQKKKGYVVNELSKENLREITKIRLVLETMAGEMASLRCKEGTMIRLRALHEQYRKAADRNDVDDLLRLNKEFHFAVYRDANMPILQQIIDALWDRISPYLHILIREIGGVEPRQTVTYHQGILDGMGRRDPKEVSRWIRTDLGEAARILVGMFEKIS